MHRLGIEDHCQLAGLGHELPGAIPQFPVLFEEATDEIASGEAGLQPSGCGDRSKMHGEFDGGHPLRRRENLEDRRWHGVGKKRKRGDVGRTAVGKPQPSRDIGRSRRRSAGPPDGGTEPYLDVVGDTGGGVVNWGVAIAADAFVGRREVGSDTGDNRRTAGLRQVAEAPDKPKPLFAVLGHSAGHCGEFAPDSDDLDIDGDRSGLTRSEVVGVDGKGMWMGAGERSTHGVDGESEHVSTVGLVADIPPIAHRAGPRARTDSVGRWGHLGVGVEVKWLGLNRCVGHPGTDFRVRAVDGRSSGQPLRTVDGFMGDLAQFENVSVSYDGTHDVLSDVSLSISSGERWVVIGPNGSGKSTMVQLLTGFLHPSRGSYALLGKRLGEGVDWRVHRTQIGFVSAALAKMMRPQVASVDVVMTALHCALEPWWHEYSDIDRQRAYYLLDVAGYGYVAAREFGLLSEGERQQVLLARSLMLPPKLLVLDEPAAGLDLGNHERLIARLATVAATPPSAPNGVAGVVLITHHVEEIAPGFTHALLLRSGCVVASGAIDDVLTDEHVSATFDLEVRLRRDDGRWTAKVRLD